MKIARIAPMQVTVELRREECITLKNALNEVCNALDIDEFSTRMGVDPESVAILLQQFGALVHTMQTSKMTHDE